MGVDRFEDQRLADVTHLYVAMPFVHSENVRHPARRWNVKARVRL